MSLDRVLRDVVTAETRPAAFCGFLVCGQCRALSRAGAVSPQEAGRSESEEGYDARGGGLRDFAVRRECEGAGADRKPLDGENPFVERKRREDFEQLLLHPGQRSALLRGGEPCSGA